MNYLDDPQFANKIQELMSRWHVPGLSIAIVNRGETYYKAFGLANIEPERPCTAETIFDIASVSKSYTAAAIALLVHDEKYPHIQWETPVNKIIPDFIMSEQSYTDDITVEDMLSHRTGLPSHDYCSMGVNADQPDTVKSLVDNLRHLAVAAPIRSKYMYCNLMYTVATYLVEQVSGQSFAGFLQTHFFEPLGLNKTFLQPGAVIAAGCEQLMATPYTWDKSSSSWTALPYLPSPENQGAGLVFTCASDHIKWVQAIMSKTYPITDGMYAGLMKPRILTNPEDDLDPLTSWTAYAAGWEISYYRGVQIIKHDGLTTGFGSTHFFIPQFEFAGLVFGNHENANDLALVVCHVLVDEVLHVPREERPDWVGAVPPFSMDKEMAAAREKHFADVTSPEALTLPLEQFTGEYWNAAYKTVRVEIKDANLHIDCCDRSMPITLNLEHMQGQTRFLARRNDYFEGPLDVVRAEFRLQDGRAVQLGIEMETDLDELTWFQRR